MKAVKIYKGRGRENTLWLRHGRRSLRCAFKQRALLELYHRTSPEMIGG